MKTLCYSLLFLLVREFKAVGFAAVFDFERKAEKEGEDAEGSKDDHGHKVSVRSHTQFADEQRHKAQTDVLHPEDEAVSRAEHFLVNDLGYGRPHGSGNEREADTEHQDGNKRKRLARICREHESEDAMARDHNDRTEQHHRRAFALVVDEQTQERREHHRQYGEPLEEPCRLGIGDGERLFEEIGGETLEGEDGGVIEYAQ